MNKIKVLVVDDSFFMRKAISKILTTHDIEVIDTAINGKEGVEKALALNPDVITMDIEMPVMNGLDAVSAIMDKKQIPILMLSTLTSEGANATVEALSRGAIDFVTKKSAFTEMNSLAEEIISKVKNVAKNQSLSSIIRRQLLISQERTKSISQNKKYEIKSENEQKDFESKITTKIKRPSGYDIHIIAIGISTGGPAALNEMIPRIPAKLPVPIVIAQHMPPMFTKSLAERINSISQLEVKEAENGEKLKSGTVYICPGGKQTIINKRNVIEISDEPKEELYKPSVNVLINSIVESYKNFAVGIIMTGMGHDGSLALKKLHDIGGYVISQDEESCIVAGMPKSVIDLHIAQEIHPLKDMADAISSLFNLKAC